VNWVYEPDLGNPFWCETCDKDIVGRIYHEESDEPLPKEEKMKALELLNHYHKSIIIRRVGNAAENIKAYEIAAVDWVYGAWKELSGGCAPDTQISMMIECPNV